MTLEGEPRSLLAAEVDDVDATYEALKAKGVTLLRPPTDQPWALRTAHFADPEQPHGKYSINWLEVIGVGEAIQAQVLAASSTKEEHRLCDPGDVALYYETRGAGRPMVMLPGWPSDHRVMARVVEPLFGSGMASLRLYPDLPGTYPDLPGTGRILPAMDAVSGHALMPSLWAPKHALRATLRLAV